MTEIIYARSPDVVWRLGPDRVLVRRVGATTDGESAADQARVNDVVELLGPVALVWLALDEPADLPALSIRLTQAGTTVAALDDELIVLASAGLVTTW